MTDHHHHFPDVTFTAPYSLLSSPIMQHPADDLFTLSPSLLQHYSTHPPALAQSGHSLIEPHDPLQSYETPSPLPQSAHQIQSVQHPTSPAPAPPQHTSTSDTQLTDPITDKQKHKVRSNTSTKQPRQDLRFGPRTKYLPCIGCDAVFDRPSALKLHMLSHTGEKPHECARCHRRFSVPSNMRRHRATCGIARSRRSFVNITMPPMNTPSSSSHDADRDTSQAARVNTSGNYLLSPDDHSGGSPGGQRSSHQKSSSQATPTAESPVSSDHQPFTVRWVEPMEYASAPTSHQQQHHQRSSHSRRFSTFVMTSPATAAQASTSDSPGCKFQMYQPQLVDDPVPPNNPFPASGSIPAPSHDHPTTPTQPPSLSEAGPESFPHPAPHKRKRGQHPKRRKEAELDDVLSQRSLASATTLSSVSSASSLHQLRQDLVPTPSQGVDTSGKGKPTTLDQPLSPQIVREEHHLADDPTRHSTALVQITPQSSTMDQGGQGEPICNRRTGPRLYQQSDEGLVELSQDAVEMFYPSLREMRLPLEPHSHGTGEQPPNVALKRKRSNGYYDQSTSEATQSSPASSSFPPNQISRPQGDQQIISDNDPAQGTRGSHIGASTSRDANLGVPAQQPSSGINSSDINSNSWLPPSLSHCHNAHQLMSTGPFPWRGRQRASSYPSNPPTLQSPIQPLHQSPLSRSSKELRFVHHHYDNNGARHEVHDTSLPTTAADVPLPNPAMSPQAVRRAPRGITLPLAPVRPRGYDNRGRSSKMSTRRSTLWLSAPTPDSGFLPMDTDEDSFESVPDVGAATDGWLPLPRLHPSYSEEQISTLVHDPQCRNARFNRYHSLMNMSHPQLTLHHSPPTPSTSHNSQIFTLPTTDTSEDDDSEGSEWEERDSFASNVPRQPYHSKFWCERLPGPAPLAAGVLEHEPARARRWLF